VDGVAEETPVEFLVQVEASGADEEEIDRLTRDLLAELRDLPVESAEIPVAATRSAGTKSFGIEALGALALKVVPSALPKIVAYLRDWLKRGDGKHIKIKASNGKHSFEVDLPAGEFSHEELQELLANLGGGGTGSAANRKRS
jgi:hypothetical protein